MIRNQSVESRRIFVDLDRCIECHACAVSCFYHHHGVTSISFGISGSAALPVICRHCRNPACIDACPNHAMVRDESGIVNRSTFKCSGCLSCVVACPFGVLSSTVTEPIPTCDLCPERLHRGLDPWCVASCSSGALRFLQIADVEGESLILLGARSIGRRLWGRR